MITIFELAAFVLVLAFYMAFLGNLPNIDYHTAREDKYKNVRRLQKLIYRLDNEVIGPCEDVERTLEKLLKEYQQLSNSQRPSVVIPPLRVRRDNLRLFRYTPRSKTFVRVDRKEERETQEFDMTKLKQLNKHGINTERDPYWYPQPRHPLSYLNCNESTRRYPGVSDKYKNT
ncbi:hypothetical protein CJU89_5056 [Yarrowia sp. B02]|nr:hypothetical protein CJU89_5056 [Yarrowia sp. B02]